MTRIARYVLESSRPGDIVCANLLTPISRSLGWIFEDDENNWCVAVRAAVAAGNGD